MKIAAISDIHGNLPALEAVLESIGRQGVDSIVCLGDLAFRGPSGSECIEIMCQMDMLCVIGNTDLDILGAAGISHKHGLKPSALPDDALPYFRWHAQRLSREDLGYLSGLRLTERLEDGPFSILLAHASPESIVEPVLPGSAREGLKADCLIVGHIHVPFYYRTEGKSVMNPGGIGFSLDHDPRASYAIFDTDTRSAAIVRVEYDIDRALRIARDRDFCVNPKSYEAALRTGYWKPIPWAERRTIDGL